MERSLFTRYDVTFLEPQHARTQNMKAGEGRIGSLWQKVREHTCSLPNSPSF